LQNLQNDIALTNYHGLIPTRVDAVVANDGTFSQQLYANSAVLLPAGTFYTADYVSTKSTRISFGKLVCIGSGSHDITTIPHS